MRCVSKDRPQRSDSRPSFETPRQEARLLRPYVPLQSGGDSPSMRMRGLPG
jgi:hypothetical protein